MQTKDISHESWSRGSLVSWLTSHVGHESCITWVTKYEPVSDLLLSADIISAPALTVSNNNNNNNNNNKTFPLSASVSHSVAL